MAQIPQGYRETPEEDRKKAKVFFDRGRTVADNGNYEYAIEMYLQGLAFDPEEVEAHQAIREISLKRKASGGKPLGMFERMKLAKNTKDDKQNMLNYEKLLAYDPGNTDYMMSLIESAHKGGYYETVMWAGPILQKANTDSPKPEFNKFIKLRDIYIDLKQWKRATEACQGASLLRPDDIDLMTVLKNLGAQDTMAQGGYEAGGSFRNSIRDREKQQQLIESDKDVRSKDSLERAVLEAEKEWQAEPNEPGKLMKLVEALLKTEMEEHEERAMQLLDEAYKNTRQFRYRLNYGKIRLMQLNRQERTIKAMIRANPNDPELVKDLETFTKAKTEEELAEYTLWAENYPTDMSYRFQMALRLFALNRHNEAIPVLQEARRDPKHRHDAAIYLARSFLEAGYADEAADTLKATIEEYELRGDEKSKSMYYWYGRSQEARNQTAEALKAYSQVAQWDFNYRDVQARIKKLRATPASPT